MSNSIFLWVERALRTASPLITSVIIVRQAGATVHGEYAAVLAWAVFLAPLAALGLTQPLLAAFVQYPARARLIVLQALPARVIALCFATILAAAISMGVLAVPGPALLVAILLALYLSAFSFDFPELQLQSTERYRALLSARISTFALCLGLRFVDPPLPPATWQLAVTALEVVAFQAASFILSSFPNIPNQVRPARAPLLKAGLLLCVSGLLTAIYFRLDVFILSRLGSYAMAGQYAAVMRIIDAATVAFPIALAPFATRLLRAEGDAAAVGIIFTKIAAPIVGAATVTALLLALAGPWLYSSIFTATGPSVARTIQIASLHPVVVTLGIVLHLYCLRIGRPSLILWQTAISAALSVSLNTLLIPSLGIVANAMTLVVSQSVGLVVLALLVFDRRASPS